MKLVDRMLQIVMSKAMYIMNYGTLLTRHCSNLAFSGLVLLR